MSRLLSFGVLQQSSNIQKSLIKYGYLYNQYAAINAVPTGFRCPSVTDFSTLLTYITNTYGVAQGSALKSLRVSNTHSDPRWTSYSGITNLNTVKFHSLPAGLRNNVSGVGNNPTGTYAYYWTSTEKDVNNGYAYYLRHSNTTVTQTFANDPTGYSVRFLRDATTPEQSLSDGVFIGQVQDIDLNVYDLVKIGTQIWSVQNLATTRLPNGNSITLRRSNYGEYSINERFYPNDDVNNVFFATENDSIW